MSDVNRDIREITARMVLIGDELTASPVWKVITRWYRDRMTAHRQLSDLRERLYRERLDLVTAK
jgi:hypothetical protein